MLAAGFQKKAGVVVLVGGSAAQSNPRAFSGQLVYDDYSPESVQSFRLIAVNSRQWPPRNDFTRRFKIRENASQESGRCSHINHVNMHYQLKYSAIVPLVQLHRPWRSTRQKFRPVNQILSCLQSIA
jgi:hypothetical protein